MHQTIQTPLLDTQIQTLRLGEMVKLTGTIYTARDAAHHRMAELLAQGAPMPFDFTGQVVYYAGPCPNRPGTVIGSVGPTTSGRMDAYAPQFIEMGLKCMIGKGLRNHAVKDAIKMHAGIYFAAIGGAGALIAGCVKKKRMVAFEDLGTEAIWALTVVDLPLIVAIDSQGADIYCQ